MPGNECLVRIGVDDGYPIPAAAKLTASAVQSVVLPQPPFQLQMAMVLPAKVLTSDYGV